MQMNTPSCIAASDPPPHQNHAGVLCWAGLGGTQPCPANRTFPGPVYCPHRPSSPSLLSQCWAWSTAWSPRRKEEMLSLSFYIWSSFQITYSRDLVSLMVNSCFQNFHEVRDRTVGAPRLSPRVPPWFHQHPLISTNRCFHLFST